MKTAGSPFKVFGIKTLIIAVFFSVAFTQQMSAQSIVGKWKLTDAKETVTDKASGKQQDISSQIKDLIKMTTQIIEFNSDNTYFTSNTMNGAKTGFEGSGTYSVTNNQIKLKEEKSNVPQAETKGSVNPIRKFPDVLTVKSQTGNMLVLQYNAETTDNGQTFLVNIEDTFTKQ